MVLQLILWKEEGKYMNLDWQMPYCLAMQYTALKLRQLSGVESAVPRMGSVSARLTAVTQAAVKITEQIRSH